MISKSQILSKQFYKPGQIAKLLNVTPKTISNYCDKKLLIASVDPKSNRRFITADSLLAFLQNKNMINDEEERSDAIYARVSTKKQNDDLKRQINQLKLFAIDYNPKNLIVKSDIGSGLNDNRKELNQLLNLVQNNKINRIFIMYKDRLTRFGFNYIKQICDFHNTKIIIVSDEENDKSLSEELAEDIIAIIHSNSNKLYGMRHKITKATNKIKGDDTNDN